MGDDRCGDRHLSLWPLPAAERSRPEELPTGPEGKKPFTKRQGRTDAEPWGHEQAQATIQRLNEDQSYLSTTTQRLFVRLWQQVDGRPATSQTLNAMTV